jgi:anthranilate synthase/aminodeoxychorismate synthase-like glutamine amidotransferase
LDKLGKFPERMLLLIDNYDSFVHNLARYFERLGQTTHVVRNDITNVERIRAMRPNAIVLSPGPCTPTEAGTSLEIVRSLHRETPILGVCLGHQIIAEALGGKVVRAAAPVHGRSSNIRHDGSGLFAHLPSPLAVGRYHSLVVKPSALPSELRPSAWTDDDVLMAFEHVELPVYGVQFHPESILTAHGYDLLANFLRLARLSIQYDARALAKNELAQQPTRRSPLPTRPVTF